MATTWEYPEPFADTNLKMFEKEALCDITLVAGKEQKHIKCHRFILASRSPVFDAMLCGPLAESSGVVCIPDIDSSTMGFVLRFMYSGKVDINAATVLGILYAARKYQVSSLEFNCKSFLNEHMCSENACTILDQAMLYDDVKLKRKCLEVIVFETESVLKSEAFEQMSKAGLQELLKCDKLNVSEPDLYIACKRWAARKCQDSGKEETDEYIRNELGEKLIRLIRFPTMTLEQFTDIVATGTVLSKDEMLMVYRSISKHENISMFKSDKRYLYSGKVEINADTVLSLLYTAKKYDVPGLESQCKSFLRDKLDVENVCTVLDQAKVFDDAEIKVIILKFIMEKSERVLKSDAFTRMSKTGLQEVLYLDNVNASECELYVGCKRWAAQRCRDAGKQETDEHIRHELGDELISLIRFPTMTLKEFTDVVASGNVLSKDELLSVYRIIVNKENVLQFNNKPRQALTAVTMCICVRCVYSEMALDGFSFTLSKDCELSALDFFFPISEDLVTGVMELLEGTTVIHTQNVKTRRKEHLLFNLDTRVHLKSTNEYFIRQRLKRTRKTSLYTTETTYMLMEGVTMIPSNSVPTRQLFGFEFVINTKK